MMCNDIRAAAVQAYQRAFTGSNRTALSEAAFVAGYKAALAAAPAPMPRTRVLPHPGSPEASAMMDSLLAEYNWPTNTKNAARAGWEAANRWLAASPSPQQDGPSDAPQPTPLACPSCGATNADDAGELCIGEDCPVPGSDDFEEALRTFHASAAMRGDTGGKTE